MNIQKLLCFFNMHDQRPLEMEKDPFKGKLEGHTGTEVCRNCNKFRRVLGGGKHFLPWTSPGTFGVDKIENLQLVVGKEIF